MYTHKRGFTLIELLVVVLIIGILAAVALPQYQVAVEKSRATQMLPIMRSIYDALALYKLEHGSYLTADNEHPSFEELGIGTPAGFHVAPYGLEFLNDTWYCYPNEEATGYVYCDNLKYNYTIWMFQPDDKYYPEIAGKRICHSSSDFGQRVCKALGGKELDIKMFISDAIIFEF